MSSDVYLDKVNFFDKDPVGPDGVNQTPSLRVSLVIHRTHLSRQTHT